MRKLTNIRKGINLGDALVCDGEAGGGGDEAGGKEQGGPQRLQWLARNLAAKQVDCAGIDKNVDR